MRAALGPLRDVAARRGVAVLIVSHLRKGEAADAVHRLSGSQALGALARCVLGVARDRATGRRVLGRLKGNLAAFPAVLGYEVVGGGAPCVRWAAAHPPMSEDEFGRLFTGGSARDSADARPAPREAAERYLRRRLAGGTVPAADMLSGAEAEGIAKRTLDTARDRLGVIAERREGHWVWSLPPTAADAA